jgi:hypothetical protein
MITTAATWVAVASWISAATVLLVDHVAKVAIPEDLIISTVGVACTMIVVRAVLWLRTPSRDYHEGWLACRHSIEQEVARQRERMAAPLP